MIHIISCLTERGLIEDSTSEELALHLATPKKLFLGIDPTADSLHIGHLLGIVVLKWFQKAGHQPFALVGGATGRIGDPSGKSQERPLLDDADIEHNVASLFTKIRFLLSSNDIEKHAVFLDNYVWFEQFNLLQFLRDIGKHFRMGVMLSKESVKARLNSEEGISFTEFSYQLLQGYDFYHLFKTHDVSLQIGGSDQWGNITAGTDLIRKLLKQPAYGLTFPLLTRSDGKKFGKTEGGAVWLSKERLSEYDFYQYLYRTPDTDVIKMLRMLTFLSMEEIHGLEKQMSEEGYVANTVQKVLAKEVTSFVHGHDGLSKALMVTQSLSPGATTELNAASIEVLAKESPGPTLEADQVLGQKVVDVLKLSGLVASKSEAIRLLQGGGVYLNNQRVENIHEIVVEGHLVEREYLLLGLGKKKKALIKLRF